MKVLFCAPVAYFILFSILGYFSYNKKRIVVNFINKKNNEVTSVKIGYNFILLWCSGIFFGLLCYLRGFINMGLAFTCLTIILIISPIIVPIIGEIRVEQLYLIVFYIQCYCSYYLAQHGNELYAKNLLEKGFEFHNTDPQIIEYVKKKWDIK